MRPPGFQAQMTRHESGLATLPNEYPGLPLVMVHTLALPVCCPVSHNPRPGSTLALHYRARECVLEVYALKRFVESFVGGHADGTRNMEAMLQRIGQAAAEALGVQVRVEARLLLDPAQELRVGLIVRPACAST